MERDGPGVSQLLAHTFAVDLEKHHLLGLSNQTAARHNCPVSQLHSTLLLFSGRCHLTVHRLVTTCCITLQREGLQENTGIDRF